MEYLARLTYYDKTGKRKGVSKSAPTHWDANRELQDLIDESRAVFVNDWLVRSPFVKAKKGELIAVAHEAKRQGGRLAQQTTQGRLEIACRQTFNEELGK